MKGTEFFLNHAQAEAAAAILRTTAAVRDRARQLLSRARQGESRWFVVDEGFLESAAAEVVAATRRRYPKLHIPLHSRWRHFEAGGVDRRAEIVGLQSASARIAIGEALADIIQYGVVAADGLADYERSRVFKSLFDAFAPGNFTKAGVPSVVFEENDIAREKRTMRPAEIQQHAVVPGDGDDKHFSDDRSAGHKWRAG